jgi:hypothetical protein
MPFQKITADTAMQYTALHTKSIYASGMVMKAKAICQISDGNKEKTNISSNKLRKAKMSQRLQAILQRLKLLAR